MNKKILKKKVENQISIKKIWNELKKICTQWTREKKNAILFCFGCAIQNKAMDMIKFWNKCWKKKFG